VGRWSARRGESAGKDLLEALHGPASFALLEASADAVVAVDGEGAVRFANRRAEAVLGGSREEIRRTPADGIVPHLLDAVHALSRRQTRTGRRGRPDGPATTPAQVTATRLDGSTFPAAVWLTPLPLRRGLLVAATVQDLTERFESRAREDDLQALLVEQRNTVDAVLGALGDLLVVLTDADGRITAVNAVAERMLGYDPRELVGLPSVVLSDPAEVAAASRAMQVPPGLDPMLEATRAGRTTQQDWTFLTRDGARRPVSLRVTAVGEGDRPSGFVCVAGERATAWEPVFTARTGTESLLLDLDDAPTRALRWQVGSGGSRRR
jgi:PAS domain S-box-containing protein